MKSSIGVINAPNIEDGIRFIVLLNNIVAIVLSFIGLRAVFVVLGTVFAISIIFNIVSILGRSTSSRLRLKNDEAVLPFLPGMAIEVVGTVAFFIMYVVVMIDLVNDNYGWRGDNLILIHSYASAGALVAGIVHAALVLYKSRQYLEYRRMLVECCPHCHHQLDISLVREPFSGPAHIAAPSGPGHIESGPATTPRLQRDSFSANSVGEEEGDSLIMKP
ncbi:hypothetical protein PV10_03434 [Exophiala mesophila]|uniref:MARVEL domain-containing protein n=1 Tax=Exophiala mesophila TaxID=212818 RepID=A0A0D2AA61_EXOME|nr:uncharacterized protein PV10_03434 [Exophiala mesophila]KIV95828.1 hypothetical protein PV10_03434 [Exophiala mesophila]